MRDYRAKNKRTIAFVRGRKKTAYGRFFRRVDRVAGGLAALGVKKGDVVMIATPTIQQGVTAFYAVSRLGAIASMIHPLMERGEFDEAVREQRPKVVFLSDMLEEGRDFPGIAKLRKLYYENLDECMFYSLKCELKHLKKSKQTIYPLTGRAFEYYKENRSK